MVTRGGQSHLCRGRRQGRSHRAGPCAKRGLRPGRCVGLWMPRGHELLIAQIAIAKAGAAWLPFDGDAPVERIAVCLADAEAKGIWSRLRFRREARRRPARLGPFANFCRCQGNSGREQNRRPRARRAARIARLSHLHFGLDRHAQGHRDLGPQYLPLSARRQ